MQYKIRNFFIIFAIILISFSVEYSIFTRIPLLDSAPNLMLTVIFFFGYVKDSNIGMLVGFFSGLCIDVFYGPVIGYNALIFVLIGAVCGRLNKVYYSNSVFIQILLIFLLDNACTLIYFFFWHILHAKFDIIYYLTGIMIPESLFTMTAGIILLRPMSALIRFMYSYEALSEAENI